MLLGKTKAPGRPTFAAGTLLSIEGYRTRIEERDAAWTELRGAADAEEAFVRNANARDAATHAVFEQRNARIHAATGVQLDNPVDLALEGVDPFLADETSLATRAAARRAEWWAGVEELRGRFPGLPELDIGDLDQERRDIGQAAAGRYARASARADEAGLSGLSRFGAELTGRGAAMLRDPLQVATLLFGGGYARGATVAGRIATTMLTEAVINAGVEASVQAASDDWRRELGLESGWKPALEQVGLAALFGAGLGGLGQAGAEAARALGRADVAPIAGRIMEGRGQEGDTEALAAALDFKLDALEKDIARLSEEQAGLDVASFGRPPEGVDAETLAEVLADALRRADDPDQPMPAGAPMLPRRTADEERVIREAAPLTAEPITIRGRPAAFTRFDPAELKTDARAYQYKDGGDAAGVTDRLRDVSEWDPTASGKVFVHERNDGGLYVADGHQRLGLAQRLQAEGKEGIRLDGFLFREKDGWTAADVRAMAAKKNMQEGSGTALDAARILRDSPEILDDGMPVSGPMMKKALALAKLSDDGWRLVVNGVVEEHHGAAVGRLVNDPSRHVAVLAELGKAQPETERMTELYVRELLAAGFAREEQTDMFGAAAVTRSLMGERVKVLDEALKLLSRDKRLFASLAQNAELIEAAGNVLDTAGNAGIAQTAETVAALIDRLARSRGVVSDLLTEAAERFANGSTAAKEARAFVAGVRETVERGGVAELLREPPRPVLKPAVAIEPATPEAVDLAALARTEAGQLTAGDMQGQPSMWDLLPDGVDGDGKARFTDVNRELEKADILDDAADLVAACKD